MRWLIRILCTFALVGSTTITSLVLAEQLTTPTVQQEFRAAWVATVANIDWPSKPGLSTEQQQTELIAILDRAVELNLNAIIFQVRPHCDALYASELEPWSEYLTGTMGQAPEPFYDPLEMIVAEAHARGLELHAWFNPYRASHPAAKSELSLDHISKKQPDIVHKYGKYLWLDPGEKKAVQHSLSVIMDVVQRYDVDGIHFDDYFYPYPVNEDGKRVDFPDDSSWNRAQARGEKLSREDWRRKNVDVFIKTVYEAIKAEKPWVKFGISPFGIWRPGYPKTISGFDAYQNLYADARKWFREGSVDYLTPQLYWKIEKKAQSFPVLLKWWQEQNVQGRHLWPGSFTSRVGNQEIGNWKTEEIVQQIELTRDQQGAEGNVHFSMVALMQDKRGLAEALSQEVYREPALVPASPWIESKQPLKPAASLSNARVSLNAKTQPWLWVIQMQSQEGWETKILPGTSQTYEITKSGITQVAVSAVNRVGLRSPVQLLPGPGR